jgi:hypothetical protein
VGIVRAARPRENQEIFALQDRVALERPAPVTVDGLSFGEPATGPAGGVGRDVGLPIGRGL